MYVDYELLRLIATSKSSRGYELVNKVNKRKRKKNFVFSERVLKHLIDEGYVTGSRDDHCSMTPKGARLYLDLCEKRSDNIKFYIRETLTFLVALAAVIVAIVK